MELNPIAKPVDRRMRLPGDKSVTHRAILFSTLTTGVGEIHGWLSAADTEASLRVAQAFGSTIREQTSERLVLEGGGGASRWQEPACPIDCANSGTTTRLSVGLATGAKDQLTIFYGDASLSRRPMGRVADPLTELGAAIWTRKGGQAPIAVRGGGVRGGTVHMAVASAQVKSSLLLAGLNATAPLTVVESIATRDHSERMLMALGAKVDTVEEQRGFRITIEPHPEPFNAMDVRVPGDPSSGAFWAALAALVPGSRLVLEAVSLNPGRLGFYQVLSTMGAKVRFDERGRDPEPWGDIEISSSPLTGMDIPPALVPSMIDELPLVALLASQAAGVSSVRGAEELRVKESDRIQTTVEGLSRMGALIEELPDGFRVQGRSPLRGARVQSHADHRIAMMLTVASAIADGPTTLEGGEAVAISYPAFFDTYRSFVA